MVNCAVLGCKKRSLTANYKEHGISYHAFPKDFCLRKKWATFCGLKYCGQNSAWMPTRTSVVCSEHFATESFEQLPNGRRKLFPDAIPTIANCPCKAEFVANLPKPSAFATSTYTSTTASAPTVSQPVDQNISLSDLNDLLALDSVALMEPQLAPPMTYVNELIIPENIINPELTAQPLTYIIQMGNYDNNVSFETVEQPSFIENAMLLQENNTPTVPTKEVSSQRANSTVEIAESERNRRLLAQIKYKNMKIHRLESRVRNLKKQIEDLQNGKKISTKNN